MDKLEVEATLKKMSKTFEEDDFKKFESKVGKVMDILQDMKNYAKTNPDDELEELLEEDTSLETLDEDNFIVKIRENRTVINKNSEKAGTNDGPAAMDQFTFMKQLEEDANMRADMRKERENIAQNFRKIGNEAFRNKEYEKSINMYTKAIDHVKDSPILYNNRALACIKLELFKRAIIDCDFVINKLDDKNLRAWLYRATCYYKLDDMKNYETSVKFAKKNNSKEIEYIQDFLEKLKIEKI